MFYTFVCCLFISCSRYVIVLHRFRFVFSGLARQTHCGTIEKTNREPWKTHEQLMNTYEKQKNTMNSNIKTYEHQMKNTWHMTLFAAGRGRFHLPRGAANQICHGARQVLFAAGRCKFHKSAPWQAKLAAARGKSATRQAKFTTARGKFPLCGELNLLRPTAILPRSAANNLLFTCFQQRTK